MKEGKIYFCKFCDKFAGYTAECPDCGNLSEELGWMKSND
jgi:primosomal protein N'